LIIPQPIPFMRPDLEAVAATAPDFYHRYLAQVPEGDLLGLLREQLNKLQEFFKALPEDKQEYAYAPGKWTPKDILGHLIDCERVFQYRVLRFARADETPLPGFEEDDYVPAGNFNARNMDMLVYEFGMVRLSSIALVQSLDAAAWERSGTANGKRISVRALVWILLGHPLHHVGVIRERYLPAGWAPTPPPIPLMG
jgi:DinB superfamily